MNDVFLSKKNTGLMRAIVLTLVVILIFHYGGNDSGQVVEEFYLRGI